jgi:hypothetical protein
MPPGTVSYCEQTRLANGITHLRLIDNSLQAADALLDYLDRYIEALEPYQAHEPLILLIEVSPIGIPPLAYLSRCYQDLLKLHENKQFHARIAYLYGTNILLSIVISFFALIRNAKYVERRFFRRHERAQAEAWLLKNKASDL